MQIYWSAVFNFSSLFHYLITQSFVVLSYTVRYMNVLADGFKVASSTPYLGEFHAMQLRDAFRPLGLCHKVNVLDILSRKTIAQSGVYLPSSSRFPIASSISSRLMAKSSL